MNTITRTILIGSLALVGLSNVAYTQSWTTLNVPSPGGNLAAIDKNSSNVYVTMTAGGIHVSTDGGSSWKTEKTNYPVGQSQLFTCTNKGTLLLSLLDFTSAKGTMFPFFKSTDNGTSWTFISNSNVPAGTGIFYHAPNNNIYFVPTYDGTKKIKYSNDDGLTWTTLTKVAKDIAIASNNDIYGLILDGYNLVLAKSTDNGTTWTNLSATGMMAYADRIVLSPNGKLYVTNNSSKVSKSTDLGISFSTLDSIFPYLWSDANSRLFGSKAKVCALSNNDGTTWSDINSGFSNSTANLGALFAHPNGTVYGYSIYGFLYKFGSGVGIAENNVETGLTIYPNPSNGKFTVNMENVGGNGSATLPTRMAVYNVLGEKVYSEIIPEKSGHHSVQQSINLSALPAGIYFLQVNTGEEIVNRKLVKE